MVKDMNDLGSIKKALKSENKSIQIRLSRETIELIDRIRIYKRLVTGQLFSRTAITLWMMDVIFGKVTDPDSEFKSATVPSNIKDMIKNDPENFKFGNRVSMILTGDIRQRVLDRKRLIRNRSGLSIKFPAAFRSILDEYLKNPSLSRLFPEGPSDYIRVCTRSRK